MKLLPVVSKPFSSNSLLGELLSEALTEAYEMPLVGRAASGAALSGMAYFRARWLFELGVIYYGWMRFNASEPWYTLEQLTGLLRQSLAELD